MPNSRTPGARVQPHLQVAGAAASSNVPPAPSTPGRDLGVRPASDITPLTGNARKRQKEALLLQQQLTPTRPCSRRPEPAAQTLSSSAAAAAVTPPPVNHVKPPRPSSTTIVTGSPPITRQLHIQGERSRDAAEAALCEPPACVARSAALSARRGVVSRPAATRVVQPAQNPGSAQPAGDRSSSKKHVPERLREYRLLGSASSNAYDVAARGGIKDNRVFVRLPDQHEARITPYWDIRNQVNRILSDAGTSSRIASVDVVKTGLALGPTRTSKTSEVLRHAEAIKAALQADEVDTRKPAILMVLNNVPTHVGGRPLEDDDPFLCYEIEMALDAKLVCPPRRLCKPDDRPSRTTTSVWIAIDPDYPGAARTRQIRLMQHWCTLRPFRSRTPPPICPNCWTFGHSLDDCTQSPRCQQCSAYAHSTENHTCVDCSGQGRDKCVPICGNCTGPHLPGDSSCKANPKFDHAVNGFILPAGRRLNNIRQAASKERREALSRLHSTSQDQTP